MISCCSFSKILYIYQDFLFILSPKAKYRVKITRLKYFLIVLVSKRQKFLPKWCQNNLYNITTITHSLSPYTAFTLGNGQIIEIWQSRLAHLVERNILVLANMSKSKDLIIPQSLDISSSCSNTSLQIESHLYQI